MFPCKRSTCHDEPVTPSRDLVAGGGLTILLGVSLALAASEVVQHLDELGPLQAGDAAPLWNLPNATSEGTLGLEDLRGKVVLMDFWATWCPPCVREMPELAKLHRDLEGRGFTVVGVNREPDDLSAVKAFIQKNELPFPVVVDVHNVGEKYRLMSLPMTVLLDRKGNIVRLFMGYTSPDTVRSAVLAAL